MQQHGGRMQLQLFYHLPACAQPAYVRVCASDHLFVDLVWSHVCHQVATVMGLDVKRVQQNERTAMAALRLTLDKPGQSS